MLLLVRSKVLFSAILRGERGMSLIEVLIALAILAIAGIAFLSGLIMTSQGVMVSQNRLGLESLAKSQMEYIKSQPYSDNLSAPYSELADIPDGYSINILSQILNQDDDPEDDDGIQQVTVTVSLIDVGGNVRSLTVSDYKVKME
jgi:prepilin-type N-terminal cleavage/methylation domain-containing protein